MCRFFAVCLAVLYAVASAAPAAAQPVCMPHEDLTSALLEDHEEQPVSMGVDLRGIIVEVFAAPSGSWTLVVTKPDGISCLLATGEHWETLPVSNAGVQS